VQEQLLFQLSQLKTQDRVKDVCNQAELARRLFPDNSQFEELWYEMQCAN
jgi:hypothetical protein